MVIKRNVLTLVLKKTCPDLVTRVLLHFLNTKRTEEKFGSLTPSLWIKINENKYKLIENSVCLHSTDALPL